MGVHQKKRKYHMARPKADTKLGEKRIHVVRVRGGKKKYRAMRLDHGTFSWGSESISRKCRIIDVNYNASDNDLVRTKKLVKNAIISVEAAPFATWYKSYYGVAIGKKKKMRLRKKPKNTVSRLQKNVEDVKKVENL